MLILPTRDPDEILDYSFNWSDRLATDTLSGAPTVTVSGATLVSQSNTPTALTFKLSGGTAGTIAKIQARAVTAGGRTIEDTAVQAIGFDPVSLATAKLAQKIDASDEDVLLTGFLRAAVGQVEAATAKNLSPKIVTQTIDGFPGSGAATNRCSPYAGNAGSNQQAIRLWSGPVTSILSVKYDDASGVEQTLSSFRLVEGANAKLLPAYGATWPVTAEGPSTVRITLVAGYDVGLLPPELELATILLFGHFNANREAVVAGSAAQAAELPLGVEALIAPYRSPGIG
jgi:hypothetical protein